MSAAIDVELAALDRAVASLSEAVGAWAEREEEKRRIASVRPSDGVSSLDEAGLAADKTIVSSEPAGRLGTTDLESPLESERQSGPAANGAISILEPVHVAAALSSLPTSESTEESRIPSAPLAGQTPPVSPLKAATPRPPVNSVTRRESLPPPPDALSDTEGTKPANFSRRLVDGVWRAGKRVVAWLKWW